MKRLEVRCCRQPQKLRGWLDVPDHVARNGQIVRFALMGGRERFVAFGSAPIAIEMEVAMFDAYGHGYLAIKSEDVPIETLRLIACFKEAPAA